MTSLIRRLAGGEKRDASLSLDDFASFFQFGGLQYGLNGTQTLGGPEENIGSSFQGYVEGAFKQNGIVFACIVARMLLFSEARFQFRRVRNGRPGDLFGTQDLAVLEKPWPNGTTGGLLSRALLDADLAGNFYANRLRQDRIARMRPDWVTIILGSTRADWEPGDLDTEVVGYLYHPGGRGSGRSPVPLLPEFVAHFAPIPDPSASYRGMSWLTPIIREIMADKAAMTHKLKFFENGATVNLVVKLDPEVTLEKAKAWVQMFKAEHEGSFSAYKTLFLGGGADAKAIGADMKQIDFKQVQGHGETRIAAAGGIPAIIVGLSEGLDAATYSNFGQARRRFADGTMRPLWREMAGSMATIINVPSGAELWYDARDISFLQEDEKDAADIRAVQAQAIRQLVDAGFKPESVVPAVMTGDMTLLEHSGMYSVQLWKPGQTTGGDPESPAHPGGAAPAATGQNGRRQLEQFVS